MEPTYQTDDQGQVADPAQVTDQGQVSQVPTDGQAEESADQAEVTPTPDQAATETPAAENQEEGVAENA